MPIKVLRESTAVKEFSRFAHVYEQYNMIQAKVAESLVAQLKQTHYPMIIDLGCGSGAIYRNLQKYAISCDRFVGVDLSSQMLDIHPSAENIIKIHGDFNSDDIFDEILLEDDALILSSSALQWSDDIDAVFRRLAKYGRKYRFAIFTSNTFKTLHKTAGIDSPIYDEKSLRNIIEIYYDATFKLEQYALEFSDTRSLFRYIQKSGVSGGERKLGYTQMKKVMEEYPLSYLEFEVLFVEAIAR